MVLYSCHECKFETKQLYNFNRHKKSKNHIEKEHQSVKSPGKNKNSSDKNNIECIYCHTFHDKTNISRHLKRCIVKQNVDTKFAELELANKELTEKLDLKDNDIRKHQNYIKEKDDYIKENDNTIKRKDMILENLIKLHKYDTIPAQELLNTFAPNAPNLLKFKNFDKFMTNRGNNKMNSMDIANL